MDGGGISPLAPDSIDLIQEDYDPRILADPSLTDESDPCSLVSHEFSPTGEA